ncbi:hypothetical protein AJ79_07903 [Helicocarpus griseus UAMH5409]|uniref:LYC1 C-terminal domain-containing protein n=1 Tax=Helicocarpus griseus UAMH5409 TaxID=1447875 RepID=A0A2B7WXR4_9EURO|nr:hypothetical protein AJ79_07903 [Helicocarpus griseus UAMH5409]
MRELAKVLPKWQTNRTEGCVASVLFSDIGKRFYESFGWHAFPSYHIEFPSSAGVSSAATPLYSADLARFCKEDEALALKEMATPRSSTEKKRFMIVPDHDHILWHHSKEEFAGDILFKAQPQVKGAITGEPGNRIWATWTHRFYETPSDSVNSNTLYILRLVVENQSALGHLSSEYDLQVTGLKAVILAAQGEAGEWGLHTVKLWGPSAQVQELIKQAGIVHQEEHRVEEGICCLLWYGEGSGKEDSVEWIGNEKYAWC